MSIQKPEWFKVDAAKFLSDARVDAMSTVELGTGLSSPRIVRPLTQTVRPAMFAKSEWKAMFTMLRRVCFRMNRRDSIYLNLFIKLLKQ